MDRVYVFVFSCRCAMGIGTQMDRVSTQAPCDWVENCVSERFDAQLQVIAQPCHELADFQFHLHRNHTEREDSASGLAAVTRTKEECTPKLVLRTLVGPISLTCMQRAHLALILF